MLIDHAALYNAHRLFLLSSPDMLGDWRALVILNLKTEWKPLIGASFLKWSFLFPSNVFNRHSHTNKHMIRIFSQKKRIEIYGFSGNVHLRSETCMMLLLLMEKPAYTNHVQGKTIGRGTHECVDNCKDFPHPFMWLWGGERTSD